MVLAYHSYDLPEPLLWSMKTGKFSFLQFWNRQTSLGRFVNRPLCQQISPSSLLGSSRTAPTKPALLIQIFLKPNHLSSLSILSDFIWCFFNRKSVIEPTPNTCCDYIVYNQSVHRMSGGCKWVSVGVGCPFTNTNQHTYKLLLPTYKLRQNIQ